MNSIQYIVPIMPALVSTQQQPAYINRNANRSLEVLKMQTSFEPAMPFQYRRNARRDMWQFFYRTEIGFLQLALLNLFIDLEMRPILQAAGSWTSSTAGIQPYKPYIYTHGCSVVFGHVLKCHLLPRMQRHTNVQSTCVPPLLQLELMLTPSQSMFVPSSASLGHSEACNVELTEGMRTFTSPAYNLFI